VAFLSGPRTPDLPSQLNTLNLEFGIAAPIGTDTTAVADRLPKPRRDGKRWAERRTVRCVRCFVATVATPV
jgi:hypothetical protein